MLAALSLVTALCAAVEAYTVNFCSEHENFVLDPLDEDLFLIFNFTSVAFGKGPQEGTTEEEQDQGWRSSPARACNWTLQPWTYLAGYAAGAPLGFRQYERAEEVCFYLEKACSGITLQSCGLTMEGERNMLYTLRTGQTPVSSTAGEVSWLKSCHQPDTPTKIQTEIQDPAEVKCFFDLGDALLDAEDQELHDVLGDLLVQSKAGHEPTATAAVWSSGCVWSPHPWSYLAGHATGRAIAFWDLQRAQDVCQRLGKVCGGVTQQECATSSQGLKKPIFTLRSTRRPLPSGDGEHSWVKICSEADELEIDLVELPPTPSDAGCADLLWFDLRTAVQDLLKSGALNLPLILSQGDVIRQATTLGWEPLLAQCAPGVLQTMLLNLEDTVYRSPPSHVDFMLRRYHRALHASIGSGGVSAASWSAWPLKEGWARVEEARRDLKKAREKSNGFCSVDIVVCFCGVSNYRVDTGELIEDRLDWMVELMQAEKANAHLSPPLPVEDWTRIFVMEKCPGEADPGLAARLKQILASVAKVVEVIPIVDQVRADDATAYMAHLAGRHYHDSADFTFFLHADAPEHIFPINFLGQVIFAAQIGQLDPDTFPFLNIGFNYVDSAVWEPYSSPTIWRKLFHSSIAPDFTDIRSYCCVQFVITKRLWHRRPQRWYQEAFDYFASAESYYDLFPVGKFVFRKDQQSRAPSQYLMPWWHVVFGEDLACVERHADPRLPLFLKTASVTVSRLK